MGVIFKMSRYGPDSMILNSNLHVEMSISAQDFYCIDCNKCFASASILLTHFAFHAKQEIVDKTIEDEQETIDDDQEEENNTADTEKKSLPDLYPIDLIKNNFENINKCLYTNKDDEYDENELNPLRFCSVTMENKSKEVQLTIVQKKKYPCNLCARVFGWPTDLKRHMYTHTGQRPYKCKYCDATFTRNFLLQKHENKIHYNKPDSLHVNERTSRTTMPTLKPLTIPVKEKESRKQDKQKIKRKCVSTNNEVDMFGFQTPHFQFIESETRVQ